MEQAMLFEAVTGTEALGWFPIESDIFLTPTVEDCAIIKCALHSLPNGTCIPTRGRDWTGEDTFTDWEHGVAIKNDSRLFFLYDNGKIESFLIDGINFYQLVHFVKPRIKRNSDEVINVDHKKVVILSHGWSYELGPDYPLIRTLQTIGMKLGWHVVVPDFRPSYEFGSQRGRAERVKLLFEEILSLAVKPDVIVLVGHSQGGAASSLACVPRVVENWNIKGLLLYGSECPLSFDAMNWIPPVPLGLIVHTKGDKVISIGEMEETAKRWNFKFLALESTVGAGERDCWGDDINHDFTAKDLMCEAVDIFRNFLTEAENLGK